MENKILRAFKKSSLDFNSRLLHEEIRALQNSSSKITIGQFYEMLGISTAKAEIDAILARTTMDKKFYKKRLNQTFPISSFSSLDDFLNHPLPKELVEIARRRRQFLEERALSQYNEQFNNPDLADETGFKRFMMDFAYLIRPIYDLTHFTFSTLIAATSVPLWETRHDDIRWVTNKRFQNLRPVIKEGVPHILLTSYLNYEKSLEINFINSKQSDFPYLPPAFAGQDAPISYHGLPETRRTYLTSNRSK